MSDEENRGTLFIENDDDFLNELSEYLDVLSNPVRLKILKYIEKEPHDVREISYEVGVSYENTKKHIQKLHLAGIIRKETGVSSRKSKGIHPVWKYSIMPGGIEAVFRNLQVFSEINLAPDNAFIGERIQNLKKRLSDDVSGDTPLLFIVGGPDDGKAYPLDKPVMRIGRSDGNSTYVPKDGDVVFPDFYGAVSRISKPHCTLYDEGGSWYIEDKSSTGGTYINGELIEKEIRHRINDGDIIELSTGARSGKIVVSYPEE
ncbi:DNA-binding Lrp family transcriptional regulator [Methanomicrobium sp. W14]|uniref:FHA domain-containing protein n=1 Tax=Methanomicrobium sp. W14 TaxID=2817839 RepID=UPI001AE69A40|nr:FHA domain-containing protein [Methanomicrobium sp. W14]MBP2132540.1 DNA-binding Lrp family transcriptional regulator [Methanomicrobium sp. W14]